MVHGGSSNHPCLAGKSNIPLHVLLNSHTCSSLSLVLAVQTGEDVWSLWLAIPHPQPSHLLIIFRKRHLILASLRATDWAHLSTESRLPQSSLTVRWLNFLTTAMFNLKPLTSLDLKNQNLSTSCRLHHILNLTIDFIDLSICQPYSHFGKK